MENSTSKPRKDGDNMTTGYDDGREQESGGYEGEPLNPFARTSRVRRTPPRPRAGSCPDPKSILSNLRGLDDKRKRTEANSPPPCDKVLTAKDKEPRTTGGDEVFVVEGSPSPEVTRELKKRKEQVPSSFSMELDETAEESAMASSLRQMMAKIEKMAGDLSYETKKNVNTKVEIKKLAREIDTMSQNLSRKLNKYCSVVGRKLKKSSDKESETTRVTRGNTQEAASQTDPPLRKSQREGGKRVTEAVTDEEIISAANKKWQEGWYEATTVRTGNPWNSTGDEDFAIIIAEREGNMETGIAGLLKDRFPEVGKIAGLGSLKVTSTTQIGTEDPSTKIRAIHKVPLGGTTDAEILDAVKNLRNLASVGSRVVAIPVPTGVEEEKFRKLAELVFRKEESRVVVHIPQRKGGKPSPTSGTREASNKIRRERDTEVLLIKQGERSYVEMVKGLRSMMGPKRDVKALKLVRKTHDGRLLLAFKKGDPGIEEVRAQIKTAWEDAVVTGGGRDDARKSTIHIKGLDAAVEDDEVWEAIHDAVPALQKEDVEIGERRPMFGGNLAVTVKVPNRFTEQLESRGKMKIGFNTCRIEERVEVIKCFRCWEFGHFARQCKGPDRRNLCSGCGKEGHVVAACRNAPRCVLCDTDGHRGGSGSCPRFREALRVAREKPPLLPQDQGDKCPPSDL